MRRLLFRLLASVPPAADHVADAELLRRFVASNDLAAFELLVRRHADAVWAVCRRTLPCDADAEDAFQATFLALVRKAKSVRAACAGGWLHRVAVNAALKLRERAARVASTDPNDLDALPAHPAPLDTELAVAVHEELARLSERERLPVVLCDLEGLSHADAATALGWPVGTVSGRLSRARAKLRDRLGRRGLTPSAALLPPLVAPPRVISLAQSLTAGTASPAVVSLSAGAIAMLKTTSWMWAAGAVVCAGLAGAGGVAALAQPDVKPMHPPPGAPPAPPAPPRAKSGPTDDEWVPKPQEGKSFATGKFIVAPGGGLLPTAFPELALTDEKDFDKRAAAFAKQCPRLTAALAVKIEPTDDTLRKLLKARLNRGVRELILHRERGFGNPSFSELVECLTDLQAVVMELWGEQPKELIPWLEEFVIQAKEIERFTNLRIDLGAAPPQVLDAVTRHRLRVEAALWKAKNPK